MAAAAQQVMLAQKWSEKVDPTGWWMSEKLDGVRAYWSGSKFYSRQGNEFIAPKFFTKHLPKEPLDGELWCGRGLFQKTISIIKKTKDVEKYAEDWKYVTYLVFDAPGRSAAGEKYESRVKWLEDNIDPLVTAKATPKDRDVPEHMKGGYAAVVGVCKCTGMSHLQKMLKQVLVKGGEGIMLRKPGSLYEHSRSHTLLKVKFFHDEEAKVTGHENGSGRLQHLMGKIHCVLPNGVAFKIGTGFSDAQRRKPPKIGSVVSFKFQEMSDGGHPRFPVFLRERGDMTWTDVLNNARTKPPFSSLKKKVLAPTLKKMHSILFSTIPSRDQETGKKVVTQDDADDDIEEEADNLLTRRALPPPAAGGAAAGTGGGAAVAGKKRGGGKRMCQWGSSCYRKNQDHLDQFEHPTREEEMAAAASKPAILDDGDDDHDGLVNDGGDPDYTDDAVSTKARKRARTDTVTSPSAPSPAAAAAASPPAPAAKKDCYYGSACYNSDPVHLARFAHPAKKEPTTVEEFIETTNQSQHDLAEYYQFGGDEEEDEVENFLAEDRNERRLSIQRFSDAHAANSCVAMDSESDERPAAAHAAYLADCASDDEEAKTLPASELISVATRVKSGAKVPRASSTAETEVILPLRKEKPTATNPTATATARAPSPAPSSTGPASSPSSCPFILPELLARAALTIEDDDGIRCKRCKQDIGDHRETR